MSTDILSTMTGSASVSSVSASEQASLADRILIRLRDTSNALNYDFCPWANRWCYWLKNPFWCLILATGISTVCGIMVKTEAFFLTALLALITLVGVLLPWMTMRGVDAHLTFDIRRSRVGKPVIVRLRVRNRWPWPVWGLSIVRGFAIHDHMDSREGVSLARVPGWSTVEYSWQFVPQRRGMYPLSTPQIETGFPFGLYRACRSAEVDGHVIVWPKTVSLQGMPDSSGSDHTDGALADRRVGEFGDMLGTRPFRNGDSLRRVHWSQTARQQSLIVCERQAPAMTSVRIVLDCDAASHPIPVQSANENRSEEFWQEQDSFELCVSVAASICESLNRQHARVELVIGDQLLVAGESVGSLHKLMDTFAMASRQSPSRRLASRRTGDDFRIAVTTPLGLQRLGQQLAGQHVVCVEDVAAEDAAAIGRAARSTAEDRVNIGSSTGRRVGSRAWLHLRGSQSVAAELPRLWKGACHG